MGRLRVRRAVKVLFAVSCKLIACNVRRWAKAHLAFFKGIFQRFIYVLETLLRNGQASLLENRLHAHGCLHNFKKAGLLLTNHKLTASPPHLDSSFSSVLSIGSNKKRRNTPPI